MRGQIAVITIGAALLAGCSTRPREFHAQLAAPSPDTAKFEHDMRLCQIMVRRGVKTNFASAAAQGVLGTAGGIGAGAVAGGLGATFSSSVGIGASSMFIAGPLIGFGVSRGIRSMRERRYKERLGACMTEYGYNVADWAKQKRLTKEDIAATLAERERAAAVAPAPAPVLATPSP